jgi:hypothetical protein
VQILGELAAPGVLLILLTAGVRLVRIVLDYRLEYKRIELQREQLHLSMGRLATRKSVARHARRGKRRP